MQRTPPPSPIAPRNAGVSGAEFEALMPAEAVGLTAICRRPRSGTGGGSGCSRLRRPMRARTGTLKPRKQTSRERGYRPNIAEAEVIEASQSISCQRWLRPATASLRRRVSDLQKAPGVGILPTVPAAPSAGALKVHGSGVGLGCTGRRAPQLQIHGASAGSADADGPAWCAGSPADPPSRGIARPHRRRPTHTGPHGSLRKERTPKLDPQVVGFP